MSSIRCQINGIEILCESGMTILEAARNAGIHIPSLCYLKDINKAAACRVCVVAIEGIGLCCLTATVLNAAGMKYRYGEMQMEVIQKLTSCISCLLVCQDNTKISLSAGKNRLIITAIGGLVGILVTVLDTAMNLPYLMVLMVSLGVLLTLLLCKAAKVPYINARIGGVTFVLVACTLSAHALAGFTPFFIGIIFYKSGAWMKEE